MTQVASSTLGALTSLPSGFGQEAISFAHGALAPVQQISTQTTLAVQAAADKTMECWAVGEWIKVDSTGELLISHLQGRFVPIKVLIDGPLLQRAAESAQQGICQRLFDSYRDVLRHVPAAEHWNRNQWSTWLTATGAGVVGGGRAAWLRDSVCHVVPPEELAGVFSDVTLSLQEVEALSLFHTDCPYPIHTLSAAELLQTELLLTRPSQIVARAAIAQFKRGFPNQIMGPGGVSHSLEGIISGPTFPRVKDTFDLAALGPHGSHPHASGFSQFQETKIGWMYESMSDAERLQGACTIAELRPYPPLPEPSVKSMQAFYPRPASEVVPAQLGSLADLGREQKAARLIMWSNRMSLGKMCANTKSPLLFESLKAKIISKYPGLDSWIKGLSFSDAFHKTGASARQLASGVVFEMLTFSQPHIASDLIQRSLSNGDLLAWCVATSTPG